jgi:putative DNA primase/helicase
MSRDLIDRSKGKWRFILTAIGIDARFLTGKHTACPICGGKDRFRFDDKNGSGSWICNHCGSGYGVHLVQKALGFTIEDAMLAVDQAAGNAPVVGPRPSKPTGQDLRRAQALWSECGLERRVTSAYLAGRGLSVADMPKCIREHDRCLYLDEDGESRGRMPAMVALITGANGKSVGIHRTFLTGNGGQAQVPSPKKIMGKLPDGAAVRLAPIDSALGIAEGIETALSASQLFGIPTWAALTAGGLEKWTPPPGASEITVFGDNDAKYRGQQAAYNLAHQLTVQGYAVDVRIPAKPGADWNDVLQEAGDEQN